MNTPKRTEAELEAIRTARAERRARREQPLRQGPRQFSSQGKDGPPTDGYLAGAADPGDCLDVLGHGSYVNTGTREWPTWRKRVSDNPRDGAKPMAIWR